MHRLTRQVRLTADSPGLGHFYTVQATIAGSPDPASGYLVNIKEIDRVVRAGPEPRTALELFDRLAGVWPRLDRVEIGISPYTRYWVYVREHPMVRFSQKYEFSAAHRLHNPQLSAQANLELFGKCNNPHGHGHNYELEVTLRGHPDATGRLISPAKLDSIVSERVLLRFDHKYLNVETAEFKELNPTVENIAQTVYRLLKPALSDAGTDLAAVTVWETPKTWCEYAE